MRGNIEGLVGNEMQGVVDLLAKAESAEPGDQAQAVQASRRLIRHVTIRLSAERQMLLRRLKVADIAAQVRRLTRQQSAVLRATEALPQQLPGRREAVTLAALEQQRTAEEQTEQRERIQLEQIPRRNRAGLLYDHERTTLTLANFCVLKGVTPEELPGLLEIARRATHPISYSFVDVDDKSVDFFLIARI